MNVKNIDIKSIRPYERNAKKHPAEQIDNIAKSIQKFGWAQPLVIDGDGVIVIGHGRYEAAKKLKLKDVPCVVIDDLTEDEIRMLRLADNKLNESDWDLDLLELELDGLDFGDLELDWGIDFACADEETKDTKYTDKVDTIQYEPNLESDTAIEDLCDCQKKDQLLSEINKVDIPEEVKKFLTLAACRHLKFNYRKIADYYAKAPADVQRLMEKSALVLIDYDDAIKNGYVKMQKVIEEGI